MDSDNEGATLRLAREEAGVSVTALATRGRLSASHLRNVEGGRRRITPAVARAYAEVLGDSMQRRNMVLGLAAMVAAPDMIMRSFGTTLHGPPGRSVDEWAARVDEYGRIYLTGGTGAVQAQLPADLLDLQASVRGVPAMWAAAARLLALQGELYDAPATARRWYQLAIDAADRSGDQAARTFTRTRAALALAYRGLSLNAAERYASDALALSPSRPTHDRLRASVALSHVHGARGQVADALAYDQAAQTVYEAVGAGDAGSDYGFPEWRVHTYRSMLFARTGDTTRGVPAQAAADATRPAGDVLRGFGAHVDMHRALLWTRAGDRRLGLDSARRTMATLPSHRHSPTLRRILTEVERT